MNNFEFIPRNIDKRKEDLKEQILLKEKEYCIQKHGSEPTKGFVLIGNNDKRSKKVKVKEEVYFVEIPLKEGAMKWNHWFMLSFLAKKNNIVWENTLKIYYTLSKASSQFYTNYIVEGVDKEGRKLFYS